MGNKFFNRITETLGLYAEDEENVDTVEVEEEVETAPEPAPEPVPRPAPVNNQPSRRPFFREPAAKPEKAAGSGEMPVVHEKRAEASGGAKEANRERNPRKKKLLLNNRHLNLPGGSKTINMPLSKKQIKVVVLEPSSFDDSQKIADYLRNNQPVVVNFETTDKLVKKRMTDFISGTIYALNGSLKMIGANILVCAPKNVDIDAGVNLYGDQGGNDKGGNKPWKK